MLGWLAVGVAAGRRAERKRSAALDREAERRARRQARADAFWDWAAGPEDTDDIDEPPTQAWYSDLR